MEIEDAFKKAAELAQLVPPALQEMAFKRALDELLRKAPARPDSSLSNQSRSVPREKTDLMSRFDGVDRTQYPEIGQPGRLLEKVLKVIRIAKDEMGIDGVRASDVARVLTEKFRVRAKTNAVQMALDSRPDLVDRSKREGVYEYRIMGTGEEFLDLPSVSPQKTAAVGKIRRPARAHVVDEAESVDKVAKTESVEADKKARGKRSGTRPGPKGALQGLIDSGYFDEPRTATQVMKHLRDKRGFTYTIADMGPAFTRMTRESKLDRETLDGQYNYKRSTT